MEGPKKMRDKKIKNVSPDKRLVGKQNSLHFSISFDIAGFQSSLNISPDFCHLTNLQTLSPPNFLFLSYFLLELLKLFNLCLRMRIEFRLLYKEF